MIWSTIKAQPAISPVEISLKNGKTDGFNRLFDGIPELQTGYYYMQKLPFINGHLQTILAARKNFHIDIQHYGRRLFNFSSGCISVDYVVPDSDASKEYTPREDLPYPFPLNTRYLNFDEIKAIDDSETTTPLLISVHGLAGGAVEPYIRSTITEMQKVAPEFDHCVLTSRGCNRSLMTTPQFFNACWTDDLRDFVDHVAKHQPKRPIYVVGYSLGGAIVANYLGQEASKTKITAACVASAPWDLNISSVVLENSFLGKHVYTKAMASNLLRLTKYQMGILETTFPYSEGLKDTSKIKSVKDYDDTFTCHAFGFNSAEDYYRHASPVNRLRNIRTPTLVISSNDDPICSELSFPYTELKQNQFVHTVTTTGGGHLGWEGASGKKWSSTVIAKYFKRFNDDVDLLTPPKRDPPTVRWFDGDRFQQRPIASEKLKNL